MPRVSNHQYRSAGSFHGPHASNGLRSLRSATSAMATALREGVDTTADRCYQRYISGFSEKEVVQFLRLFEDPDFTVNFDSPKADRRARALATALRDKTKICIVQRAIDVLSAQPRRNPPKAPDGHKIPSSDERRAQVNLKKRPAQFADFFISDANGPVLASRARWSLAPLLAPA